MRFPASVGPAFVLSLLAPAALVAGCSGRPDLPSFNDLPAAPPAIQRAARAVVRIHTANQSGTGSFISATGLLLTNNHVLGAPVCPVEGCAVQLTFLHQRGEPRRPPRTVFVVPVAVDIGLDLAVVQVHASPLDARGPALRTPSFLRFSAREAAALAGTHVTIVGHPEGTLKKWTDGVVVSSSGSWFEATAFILPGDSGSPVLDDDGAIVGLIHRAPTGEDLITSHSYNADSIGTASAPLIASMDAPLPDVMISTADRASPSFVVAHSRVYLNGRAEAALVDDAPTSVLALLGEACDAGLSRDDFQSPEDLGMAVSPCRDAMTWIDCRAHRRPFPTTVVCPEAPARAAWARRFQSMNERARAMNGKLDLSPISFGIASLSASMSAGQTAGAESLQKALAEAKPELDFNVAKYLAAFGITSYRGQRVVDLVRGFTSVPHYELFATDLVAAVRLLDDDGALGDGEARAILSMLDGDPEVSVGSKLYLEDTEYTRGWDP